MSEPLTYLATVSELVSEAYGHLERGANARALRLLSEAVGSAPEIPVVHYLLGIAETRERRNAAGIEHLRKAVALEGGNADYQLALGEALLAVEQSDAAAPHLRRAIELGSKNAEAFQKFAAVLVGRGQATEALRVCENGLQVCGLRQPGILNSLALALRGIGQYGEALECLHSADALRPNDVTTLINQASVLFDIGRVAEAQERCERACALEPSNARAQFNLSFALLAQRRFREGFERFEARLALRPSQLAGTPRWDGADLQGRRILLECEQGAGDMIQFVRYVEFVKARGGRVILQPPAPLTRLFGWLEGCEVFEPGAAVAFDTHCGLMSLPLLAKTELETIPPPAHFSIPAEMARKWVHLLGAKRGLRVGLAWAGSARNSNDRNRSIAASCLAPLFAVNGIDWFSLQVSAPAAQLSELRKHGPIRDLGPALSDYAETAAALSQLDLMISVDTSVAHLAGSVAPETWLLIPFATDWRWMPEQGSTSWYPNARIFRQQAAGDWPAVLRSVAEALRQRMG